MKGVAAIEIDIELKLREMKSKLADLRELAESSSLNLEEAINRLEEAIARQERDIYLNLSPWQKVQLARHKERPTTLDYISLVFDDFIELHGDRRFKDDSAIVGGLALLSDRPVTVIGHQKGRDLNERLRRNFGMPHPEGYRKALRLMKQAEKFGRPVICFIDTPGAYCGIGSEERGQGQAIAENLMEMSSLAVPIVSVIIGEGGSGGALALGVADRVLMLKHAVYSVISPEGFASILWKDASRAAEAAGVMKLTAQDLLELNVIDRIVEEREGAHRRKKEVALRLKRMLSSYLNELCAKDAQTMLAERYAKYRGTGMGRLTATDRAAAIGETVKA